MSLYSEHVLGPDVHANRPVATAVPKGAVYSCTTHSLIYRSDGAAWQTWATLGGGGGGGSSTVKDPRWNVLAGQAAVDEFNDSSLAGAWTRVDGTGAASGNVVYTEDGDVLSVKQEGGDTASCIHGLVRPLSGVGGALSVGDGFVAGVAIGGAFLNFAMFGLVLADGNTFGAGNQVAGFAFMSTGGLNHDCREFTGWNSNPTTVSSASAPFPFFKYQRIALIAANTWRHDWSPDGVSWVKGTATLSKTMTATQVGVLSSSWGTSTKTVIGYEFLRRVAGVT